MEAGKSSEFVGGGNLSPRWVPGLSVSSVQLTFVTFWAANIRPYGLVRTIQRTAVKTATFGVDKLPTPTDSDGFSCSHSTGCYRNRQVAGGWYPPLRVGCLPFDGLQVKWRRGLREKNLISLIRMHPGRGDCPPWGYFSIGVLNFQLFFTSLYKKYILQCVQ